MDLIDLLEQGLGLNARTEDLTVLQVSLRCVVVFLWAILVVRLGARRFMARRSAVDVILAFVLGSMLSRTINGPSPLIPTLVGGLVLVLVHRVFMAIAFRWHGFGNLIKGKSEVIIENGQVNQQTIEKNFISKHDLEEDLRLSGCRSPAEVKYARLERSGDVSVIKQSDS